MPGDLTEEACQASAPQTVGGQGRTCPPQSIRRVEQARDAGALAFLVKPFQKSDLIPAIEVAMGRFRELRTLTGEIDALGEQLESRKVIERAKGFLIDELSMSETDAFAFIQRTAMSERTRMRDVADRILDGSLRPGTA